jgi:hypothetical protein
MVRNNFLSKKLITGHQKSIDNFGKGVPNLGDTKGIEVGNILVHGSLEGHKNWSAIFFVFYLPELKICEEFKYLLQRNH